MIHTVGVVVPAANEQAHIGECLNALIHAREYAQSNAADRLEVRIIVVLDSCVDGTASIVNQHPGIEAARCSAGCVGSARALGVRHLLDTCTTARSKIWLANTDADSRVPANWITSMLAHAERGAHLVLGTVTPDDGLDVHRRHAWLARHHLRNGHPHIHGANFGIRADTYQALGGWPALACAEDITLAHRATATGHLRIVRTAAIPVTTSSRLAGRAPDGFASHLRALSADTAAS